MNGSWLALGAAGVVAALSRPPKGSGALSTDELKALNAAFEVWGLGTIHPITPYQQHIWDTRKIVVCPHGFPGAYLNELSLEYGALEREAGPGGSVRFSTRMRDRDHIESFFFCDHRSEGPLITSVRHLGGGRSGPIPIEHVQLGKGVEVAKEFYFPAPEGFWEEIEIEQIW